MIFEINILYITNIIIYKSVHLMYYLLNDILSMYNSNYCYLVIYSINKNL